MPCNPAIGGARVASKFLGETVQPHFVPRARLKSHALDGSVRSILKTLSSYFLIQKDLVLTGSDRYIIRKLYSPLSSGGEHDFYLIGYHVMVTLFISRGC